MNRAAAPLWAALAVAGLLAAAPPAAATPRLVETPMFRDMVRSGALPPVIRRVPKTPAIVEFDRPGTEMGRHGGVLRILMRRARDVRMMVVYGYARLVGYDTAFRLRADILERIEVEDRRRFTLYLRAGHKWSDGRPFTADDFRYYWEDVANNRELSPIGPPRIMKVGGKPPRFEVVNPTTVRFTWSEPNPDFLPALARASPLYIYRPAHYLRRFHKRYADPSKLAAMAAKAGVRNWASLHNRRDRQYKNSNPELPTLQPWVTRTRPPAQRFEFVRNPYYYRVDGAGRQLPYLDRVVMSIVSSRIVPAKTGAGESQLQARGVNFSDYTFLKKGEKRHNYSVRLWQTAKGGHFVLFPNLNIYDPAWRKLFQDVRFRRALSLAINRHEINQVVYFGLAIEGNNTALAQSPLYRDAYRTAWASFDLARANALLDELGLARRNDRGIRLLPDGRPMNIIVETAGEDTEQTDVLELIRDSWLRAGIKLFSRPSQREVFRNRIFAGETMISVWSGWENGVPNADISPHELAPTSQYQLQWPKWGQYFQTGGRMGAPPSLPVVRELLTLYQEWKGAPQQDRRRIWHRMLQIHADNALTIGVIAGVPQPVVVDNRLRNVPLKGVYNWNPGAHFGIYKPDTFWLDGSVDTATRRR